MRNNIFEVLHPDFEGYILPGTRLFAVAGGFRFLEGPVWDSEEYHLIFSDIMGNALYTYSPAGGVTMFRENSYMANGNTQDLAGNLLTCEHATSRVSKTERKGSYSVVVDRYDGKQLNSPNDIVVRSDGTIFFTDPASGRSAGFGVPREQELPFAGVYRFDPTSGELKLLIDDFEMPNGLCFSPDEKKLFINDTRRQHIRSFDIDEEGNLSHGLIFAELIEDDPVGKADGMKFDASGLLFCTGPGGIQIFNQDALCVGRIFIPEQAANFCWGGQDYQTLYITASKTLYSFHLEKPGTLPKSY